MGINYEAYSYYPSIFTPPLVLAQMSIGLWVLSHLCGIKAILSFLISIQLVQVVSA